LSGWAELNPDKPQNSRSSGQNFNLGRPENVQNVQYISKRLKQKVYVVDLKNHTSEMSLINSSHFI
jgi:hypothetical protein